MSAVAYYQQSHCLLSLEVLASFFFLILSYCIDTIVILRLTASISTFALQANLITEEKKVTRRFAIGLSNPPTSINTHSLQRISEMINEMPVFF